MRRIALAVPLLLVALAGCGQTASSTTGVDEFRGDEKAVAQVIADLADDGSKGDETKICRELISSALNQRIEEAGTKCTTEMRQAIADADGFELKVTDVSVTGSTATVEVESTDRGETTQQTFTLQRDEQRRWKILRFAT